MGKIKKTKVMLVEIFEKDEQFWTTSLDVAEKFEKQHKDVLKAIRNLDCSEEFSRRNFAPSEYKDDRGKDQKSYFISRGGFSFLAMGFTGKRAAEWKEKYIEAFDRMEATIIEQAKQLRKQANKEWKQLRENSKEARKIATDAYKKFVDYAIAQGTHNGPRWYSLLTEAGYDAFIIPGGHMEIRRRKSELHTKNGKDTLTAEELIRQAIMDLTFTNKIVDEALDTGGFYKKLFPIIKDRMSQYGRMIENSMLLQNNTKALTLEN